MAFIALQVSYSGDIRRLWSVHSRALHLLAAGNGLAYPTSQTTILKKEWNDLSLIMLYQIWVLYAITLHSFACLNIY